MPPGHSSFGEAASGSFCGGNGVLCPVEAGCRGKDRRRGRGAGGGAEERPASISG